MTVKEKAKNRSSAIILAVEEARKEADGLYLLAKQVNIGLAFAHARRLNSCLQAIRVQADLLAIK